MKKRTANETATANAKAIKTIQTVIDASITCATYDFFDTKAFRKTGFDQLVTKICNRYDVKEDHIREVACWAKS